MAIEIWNGSTWVTSNDPEIYDGSTWANINKGEIYNGSGWSTFYQRFSGTVNTPTITLSSRTVNSITVQVTLPTGSPYKTQVTVYRTSNPLGASNIPATAAVGAISGFKTETGLSPNTSYSFSAYASYYDATTNDLLQQSATVSQTFSTLDYIITTPTTPVNSARTISSLSFQADSNANYSTNGSAAYIQFEFYQLDIFSGWFYYSTVNRNLTANDTTQTLTATITGLNSGDTFRCRARTVYSDISQTSAWSSYSGSVQTKYYETQYKPSSTDYAAGNETTYFSEFAASGTSIKDADRTYLKGSDNNTGTEWMSNPYTTVSTPTNVSKTISELTRALGVTQYKASAGHGLALDSTISNYTNVSITRLIYSILGMYTDARYINVDIDGGAPSSFTGTIIINGATGTNASYFNGTWTIVDMTSGAGGARRIRISRPSTTPQNIGPSGAKGSALFAGNVNGFAISSLGGGPGESPITTTNSTTLFSRADTSGGVIATTGAAGTLTYTTYTDEQVAKTGTNDEILRLAFQPNLPAGATSVQLEGIQTRCGGVASPRIVIEVNGGVATRTLTSGLSANATDAWSVPSGIQPNTTNLGVSNCWYIALTVRSGTSSSLLYSTISEVQLRYSYQVLV